MVVEHLTPLDIARANATREGASATDLREYGRELRLEAARLRGRADGLDSLADATFRRAVDMPQSAEERREAIRQFFGKEWGQ